MSTFTAIAAHGRTSFPKPDMSNPTSPATPDDLFRRLADLGIETTTVTHPPLFTVDQAKALRGELPGAHIKNLFLRDKKKAMWLVVCLEDRAIDLVDLAGRLGSARLSFGRPERLMEFLGVIPGAVSPFAVVNDPTGQVGVALDRDVLDREPINAHPLDNRRTTAISAADLMRFLEAEGHPPLLLDFS